MGRRGQKVSSRFGDCRRKVSATLQSAPPTQPLLPQVLEVQGHQKSSTVLVGKRTDVRTVVVVDRRSRVEQSERALRRAEVEQPVQRDLEVPEHRVRSRRKLFQPHGQKHHHAARDGLATQGPAGDLNIRLLVDGFL